MILPFSEVDFMSLSLAININRVFGTIYGIEMDWDSEEYWRNEGIAAQPVQYLKAIHSIEYFGSFSTFGQIENFIMPGIRIDDNVDISLPLMPEVAADMLEYSQLVPFGKGSETIIDINIRHTWQIDPARITFENQA